MTAIKHKLNKRITDKVDSKLWTPNKQNESSLILNYFIKEVGNNVWQRVWNQVFWVHLWSQFKSIL